ncbi:IS21 family transposase, partial [Priestia megaterium]
AHARAFQAFGGVTRRGIYDNMKTAVEAVFTGKTRRFNRRFEQMCSHYLIEPVACTPASGWEKGQVENQVGYARDNIFKPRLRFHSLEELNGWLEAECVRRARNDRH